MQIEKKNKKEANLKYYKKTFDLQKFGQIKMKESLGKNEGKNYKPTQS